MRSVRSLDIYHRYIEPLLAQSNGAHQANFRPTLAIQALFGISIVALTAMIIHSIYGVSDTATQPTAKASQATSTVTSHADPSEPPVAKNNASDDQATNIDTNSSTSSNSASQSTTVTVNGQNIDLPPNSTVHKTITHGNSSTTIDYSSNSGGGDISTDLSVQSSSSSKSDDGQ